MWFCPCTPAFPFICPGNQTWCGFVPVFPFICPGNQRRGSAAAFPVLFLVLLEGWDGAGSGPARIRPCHSRWEFSVHTVKRLEAGLGRAGTSPGALGFHSAFPERKTPGMRALPPKETRSVASSVPMALGKPGDSDKALFCGRTCCSSFPPGFSSSQ